MRLYISGPISGKPDGNRQAFTDAERVLTAHGYEVINPRELGGIGDASWATYMRRDIVLLMECDGIAMLDGWQHSHGATLEHYIADELDMPFASVEGWCSR